jgi:GyrI-like small molecule binding domain
MSNLTAAASSFPKIIATSTQRFFGIIGHGPFDTCGPLFNRLTEIATSSTHGDQPLLALPGVKRAMLVLCDVPTTAKEDLEWAVALFMPSPEYDHVPVPPDGSLQEIIVPGHDRVATTLYRGPYQGLPTAWNDLCFEYIPSQGGLQRTKGSPQHVHYEIYVKACDDDDDSQQPETQLFCPVQDIIVDVAADAKSSD